jgi:hypothetical protein
MSIDPFTNTIKGHLLSLYSKKNRSVRELNKHPKIFLPENRIKIETNFWKLDDSKNLTYFAQKELEKNQFNTKGLLMTKSMSG